MWTLAKQDQQLPLYRQIVTLIEQLITQGHLSANERLPSERQLSQLLHVNRSTIIRAITELTERGILLRKQGSGTYINPQKWGIQCYPLLNWRSEQTSWLYQSNQRYAQHIEQLRTEHMVESKPLIDLANGDLPNELLPELMLPTLSWQELIKQEQGNEMSYKGLMSLRKHLRHYLAEHFDLAVEPEQILITTGAQQALFLITQCLLKPGDAIGIESTSYFYSLPIFQAAGLRLYGIPMDHEGITVEGLEQVMAQHGIKMLFLNPIFQNPTGCMMSNCRKKALIAFCKQHHIPIIEDDPYSLLAFNSQKECRPIKYYDSEHQVIYIGSLSKYMGKNIRIGWVIAPAKIVNRLAQIRHQIDSGLSLLPQLLAEHYLIHHHKNHCDSLKTQLKIKAEHMCSWLQTQFPEQLNYEYPQGGFHLYAHFYKHDPQKYHRFLQQLLEKRITFQQGSLFGDSEYYLRLSFAHWSTDLNNHCSLPL